MLRPRQNVASRPSSNSRILQTNHIMQSGDPTDALSRDRVTLWGSCHERASSSDLFRGGICTQISGERVAPAGCKRNIDADLRVLGGVVRCMVSTTPCIHANRIFYLSSDKPRVV
jgi:hypothetical protein